MRPGSSGSKSARTPSTKLPNIGKPSNLTREPTSNKLGKPSSGSGKPSSRENKHGNRQNNSSSSQRRRASRTSGSRGSKKPGSQGDDGRNEDEDYFKTPTELARMHIEKKEFDEAIAVLKQAIEQELEETRALVSHLMEISEENEIHIPAGPESVDLQRVESGTMRSSASMRKRKSMAQVGIHEPSKAMMQELNERAEFHVGPIHQVLCLCLSKQSNWSEVVKYSSMVLNDPPAYLDREMDQKYRQELLLRRCVAYSGLLELELAQADVDELLTYDPTSGVARAAVKRLNFLREQCSQPLPTTTRRSATLRGLPRLRAMDP